MTTWTRAQQRQHRAAWAAKDAVGLAWEQGAVGLVGARYNQRRRTPGMTSQLAHEHMEHGDGWVSVVVPIRTVSLTNQREHWATRARRAKAERQLTWWYLEAARVGSDPLPRMVTLTRLAPRRLDSDNLASACKSTRDGVADRLGIDDGDPRIEWRYAQRSGAYGIEIRIEWITQPKGAA